MNEEYPSPDKRYLLSLGCNEYRMSLWVCSPMLEDLEEKLTLFNAGSLWDAGSIEWSEDSRTLSFFMRKYPGSPKNNYKVVIHLDTLKAELAQEGMPMEEVDVKDLSKKFRD